MNPHDLTLYSYRRCPFAMRVRMTLHEKKLTFVTKEEDIKNFSEELKKLHPQKRVPVLLHSELALYESSIITEYLEDQFPEIRLMPSQADQRANIRLLTFWCNQVFKPHVDHFKYGLTRSNENDVVLAPKNLHEDLKKLNDLLQQNEFLQGNCLTLADIHVFPFVRQLMQVKPMLENMDSYTELHAWIAKITTRESFIKTMEVQK